jgi:hypothetical protein
MNEDDRDFTALDPANLLPFGCILESENPAIRIPSTFIPNEPLAPVDNDVFLCMSMVGCRYEQCRNLIRI